MTAAAVPDIRCFTAKEVRELAGVTYRQLDYWTRTGRLKGSGLNGLGSGTPRNFTLGEVVEVATMQALIRAGFRVDAAAKLASPGRREHWETA